MTFQESYAKLNPAQRQAVDLVEGCVMVVAGPGTGKTQVLGMRIAKLLESTGHKADDILCLTFTEAATVALRNRLFELIGSAAHRVNIHTYHGFCNMLIQENRHLFGFHDLDAASELDILEVLTELIDELDNTHLLKRLYGSAYYDLDNLRKLFGLMKKDHLHPEEVERLAMSHLQDALHDERYYYKRKTKTANIGDLKPDYQLLKEQMERLIAAAHLLEVYDRKMAERRRYDFNDMINWVIDLLQKDPVLLTHYQERFQHILVDEYQDTNGSQNQLLYLLIAYSDNPNVFVVGDDDQSIYKFQGANVMNIRDFHERYKEHIRLVVLEENYRSTPSILQGSNAVIRHNDERIINLFENLHKDIRAAHTEISKITDPIELRVYPNTFQEVIGLAQTLQGAHKAGTPFNEMAVLYRNHDQSLDLMNYLQAVGIPFNVSRAQDILEVPVVRQFLQLLEYLVLEDERLDKGQHLLFDILHFQQFRHLRPFDIARIAVQLKGMREQGWREALHHVIRTNSLPPIGAEGRAEIERFLEDVEYWLKEMHNRSLQVLVEHVMAKGGFIARALAGSDSIFEIQCLRTLFNFLKEENAKHPDMRLRDFLLTIDLLKTNGIKLNVNKVIHGANGVNLMTVHGSKGLEFDHVHMMGCTADKWERSGQRLPFTLNKVIPGEPERAYEEEGRRLFYVGITRARRQLHISYALVNQNEKELNKSVYVNELEESEAVHRETTKVDEAAFAHFFARTMERPSEHFRRLSSMDFVDQQLLHFRMSATNLNNYLRCPVAFFYENIIRVPSAKNDMATFGTAVHDCLELYFAEMLQDPDRQFPPVEKLGPLFQQRLARHRESFTKESYERYKALGTMELPKYATDRMPLWTANTNVEVEAEFKTSELDGIPIRGKIDKIIIEPNGLVVVDYKTGKVKNALPKLKPPLAPDKLRPDERDHQKIHGGDYWRQMVFYKILIDTDPRYTGTVRSGLFDFVEHGKDGYNQASVPITEQDMALVKTQIRTAYTAIMNKEFERGCEQDDCTWCTFNRYYLSGDLYRSGDLLQREREEMDER